MRNAKTFFQGTLLLLIFSINCVDGYAQMMLEKEIQFSRSAELSLRQMLDSLSVQNDVYFSYESTLLELDKSLETKKYSGTIGNLLLKELGNEYEYKELPGYIIIRYAPEKLDLDAEISTRLKTVTVKGYIKNSRTNEGVSRVSIYDKTSLASTLTDEEGYFKLRYKQKDASIWLTLRKENYRDTTFLLLPTVSITAKKEGRNFLYIPDDGSSENLEGSFLGNLFIGFKQRLQGINVGNFFAESPFQMSLIPGWSSKGMFNSQTISKLSLNLIGGYTAGIEGLEVAGIFNINKREVKSVQVAGVFNLVGGSSKGLQVGGIYNSVYRNVDGLQVAGIYNRVRGNVKGVQLGGLLNKVDNAVDFQIAGLANRANFSNRLQLAGIFNQSKKSAGVQFAGLANTAGDAVDHQISGVINRAKKVNGFQFSLVNIAEESDYPFGLLNFIKDGEKNLGLSLSESGFTHLSFRSGGRKIYGILGAVYNLREVDRRVGIEVGFGIHLFPGRKFSLDSEFVSITSGDLKETSNHLQSLRVFPGYQPSKHFRIFAGPSINFAFLDPGQEGLNKGWNILNKTASDGVYRSFGGLTAGIQIIF